MVATTSAAIAASMRNPITEETTRNASNTPAEMTATLNQRIHHFSLERSLSGLQFLVTDSPWNQDGLRERPRPAYVPSRPPVVPAPHQFTAWSRHGMMKSKERSGANRS